MQRLDVSGAVRPIYGSLGVKRLIIEPTIQECNSSKICWPPNLRNKRVDFRICAGNYMYMHIFYTFAIGVACTFPLCL